MDAFEGSVDGFQGGAYRIQYAVDGDVSSFYVFQGFTDNDRLGLQTKPVLF